MGVYANIGGSSKQISSIYDNIDGTSKKLSALYANINGSKKNILEPTYVWYRYPATSWEDNRGTSSIFSYTDTDYRECSLCGGHHYYYSGYLSSISDGDKVYSSYGFNTSTGLYYGSGSSLTYSSSNIENSSSYYNGYYYFSSYHHCLYLIGSYIDNGENEHGWSNGSGHDISAYRFGKPLSYSESNYEVITSKESYLYKNGFYYSVDSSYWEHRDCHDSDMNDGANNDEMEWYTGYYVKYIGKF